MIPIGTVLPPFDLAVVPGTNFRKDFALAEGNRIANHSLLQKPLLLMILCAHCPFVKHLEKALSKLDQDYAENAQLIAIASNSLLTHPQDGPEYLAAQANEHGWRFPYLLDVDQSFARALKAACTPDFFLFSPSAKGEQKLRYRGQFDESRPGNDLQVTGKDVRAALDAVLNGKSVGNDQKPSIGCNIKWHPGKEPSWFG